MQYRAFEPGIEVNGQTVFAIVDGFDNFKSIATSILLRQGIGNMGEDNYLKIDPQAWYPQEAWLSAFEEIAQNFNSSVLFQIGLTIPKNAIFPPWVKDIESAVQSIDIAYHLNHRKEGQVMFDVESKSMLEGIGHYGFEKIPDRNMIISKCENPYPCDFDRGILTTMAKKFELRGEVMHDDSQPCRKNGAESCTYLVRW